MYDKFGLWWFVNIFNLIFEIVGTSSCLSGTYYDQITEAKKNGFGLVYINIWTLNGESSMKEYIDKGVTGIITNKPGVLRDTVNELGITLAGPEQGIDKFKYLGSFTNPQKCCECEYDCSLVSFENGCRISIPSPHFHSCKCTLNVHRCYGTSLSCDEDSILCKYPSDDLQSCLLGGGDCNGYTDSCDCTYSRWGCRITKPAPEGLACKCEYRSIYFRF